MVLHHLHKMCRLKLGLYLQARKEPKASPVTRVEACRGPVDHKALEVRQRGSACGALSGSLTDASLGSFPGRFARQPSGTQERPGGPAGARGVPRSARTGRRGGRAGSGGVLRSTRLRHFCTGAAEGAGPGEEARQLTGVGGGLWNLESQQQSRRRGPWGAAGPGERHRPGSPAEPSNIFELALQYVAQDLRRPWRTNDLTKTVLGLLY